MSKSTDIQQVRIVSIDLGKTYFQVHGIDDRGKKLIAKKVTRNQLKELMIQL
ncbi:MAG: transposase [Candidatus Azotimanducaceae bacterium]|jgi:transposase